VGSIGQIDILARRKNGQDWLIVELKRDQSGDATVGQLLRYMGFVKHSLAKETDKVFGLIIAHALDEKLHYAVSINLQNVAVHTYEVEFKLGPPTKDGEKLLFELMTLGDLPAES
jgi:RecB family endonuclease NucS